MRLDQLPKPLRPREKLLSHGACALTDVECLALLLRTGTKGIGVLQLSQALLQQFDGLHGLLHAPAESLKPIKGLGPAKRAEIMAVLELARRALSAQLQQKPIFNTAQAVGNYLRLHLGARPIEVFAVMFLDSQHRLLALEELFRGSLTQAPVYPREIAVRALQLQAAGVVLAHNHPSGQIHPSVDDIAITQQLQKALSLIEVRVLDHFIITAERSLSLLEQHLMPHESPCVFRAEENLPAVATASPSACTPGG